MPTTQLVSPEPSSSALVSRLCWGEKAWANFGRPSFSSLSFLPFPPSRSCTLLLSETYKSTSIFQEACHLCSQRHYHLLSSFVNEILRRVLIRSQFRASLPTSVSIRRDLIPPPIQSSPNPSLACISTTFPPAVFRFLLLPPSPERMRTVQDLPYDIILRVFELVDSKAALRNAAVVCDKWTEPAQERLWKDIAIWRRKSLVQFINSPATLRGIRTTGQSRERVATRSLVITNHWLYVRGSAPFGVVLSHCLGLKSLIFKDYRNVWGQEKERESDKKNVVAYFDPGILEQPSLSGEFKFPASRNVAQD